MDCKGCAHLWEEKQQLVEDSKRLYEAKEQLHRDKDRLSPEMVQLYRYKQQSETELRLEMKELLKMHQKFMS
jgi:hypothetical protein